MNFDYLTNITLSHYLILALMLFSIGLMGIIISKNFIKVLISIELMLNAVCINMVAFASYNDGNNISGMIFALFIIAVSSAQAAIGIALLLAFFRYKHSVNTEDAGDLKD